MQWDYDSDPEVNKGKLLGLPTWDEVEQEARELDAAEQQHIARELARLHDLAKLYAAVQFWGAMVQGLLLGFAVTCGIAYLLGL